MIDNSPEKLQMSIGNRQIISEMLLVCLAVAVIWYYRMPILLMIRVAAMEPVLLYLLPPISLIVWIWVMATRVRRLRLSKYKLIWVSFKSALSSIFRSGIAVVLLGLLIPGHLREMWQLHADMERDADIPAIRQWMQSYHTSHDVVSKIGHREYESIVIRPDELPDCISVLRPRYVHYNAKMKCLSLVYGSGFGHWGFSVAPRGTRPSTYRKRVKILEDGAWVWAEVQ